jgi:hypothetical protein
MTKPIVLIAAAAAVTVIAVPAASAGGDKSNPVKIDSRVTLPRDDPGRPGPQADNPFYGRVESRKHACEVHRLVKVFKVRPGRDRFVDGDVKDRSNQRGEWRVGQALLAAGNYYAKVLRRKVGTAGTTFVCRGDRSPTRQIHRQS